MPPQHMPLCGGVMFRKYGVLQTPANRRATRLKHSDTPFQNPWQSDACSNVGRQGIEPCVQRSIVTATTIGAVGSSPFRNSILLILSLRFGVTLRNRTCCPRTLNANSLPGTSTRRI